ncbi:hypothetical protein LZ318_30215 [Saccharopolyspora indica]|uniref:hypothetical protein n=1 Tax=Saccharopolyspora indica TaxID=1229659 RepID=UPI0022EA8143|nr:hypothetical protein [Saccharopolyspora indica]MDA3644493.1 hypothetical protein [Saccharopolyspora indica]
MTALAADRPALRPGPWTAPLLVLTGLASVIFTIGTAVHGFLVVNEQTLRQMMELAGVAPESAAEQVPGFLLGFRAVGCLYVIGNALGVLALRRRPSRWLFWVVLAVNATQAAGVVMVPPAMFTAARETFGVVGVLPSLVTDAGAGVLALVLIVVSISTRGAWGQVRR